MLIPLLDLIAHFDAQLYKRPSLPQYDPSDIADSTVVYLNLYRQTQIMLNKLGEQSNEILRGMRLKQDVLP